MSDYDTHISHILIINKICAVMRLYYVSVQTKATMRRERIIDCSASFVQGGTGKTLLSVNLAVIFADKVKKVCLLDYDLRAPSLNSTFNNNNKYRVNYYLKKACKVEDILTDCTPHYITEGQLFVGLVDPSI